jgi:hypothetical protein
MLRVARLIVAGVGLLGLLVAISAVSYHAGSTAQCTTGDMSGPLTPENIKEQQYLGFDWARHALTCRMGDYQVVTPTDPGRWEGGFVLRKGRRFLDVNNKETALFDDSGQHVLFYLRRATQERSATMTYSIYDQAKGAWIENFDFGADGTVDFRTTEINGRRVKQELRVGEQWLEVVQQDGRSGVVFNGRFMPVADAIKLSEKSKTDGK